MARHGGVFRSIEAPAVNNLVLPKPRSSKERLDVVLQERGLVDSRTKAQALILAGQVKIDEQIVTKVGALVADEQTVSLVAPPKYVSRGGEKLEGALDEFALSPAGKVCLDVGSSTGGFTDCLLQRGALKVFAIDVGRAQLDPKLLRDARVVSREETHILNVKASELEPQPTFCVVDASFISLRKILPHLKQILPIGCEIVALVKPQFEVGAKHLKKGIVRSVEVQKQAVSDIIAVAKAEGFHFIAESPSKLKGPKGNQEYFIHLQSESAN